MPPRAVGIAAPAGKLLAAGNAAAAGMTLPAGVAMPAGLESWALSVDIVGIAAIGTDGFGGANVGGGAIIAAPFAARIAVCS